LSATLPLFFYHPAPCAPKLRLPPCVRLDATELHIVLFRDNLCRGPKFWFGQAAGRHPTPPGVSGGHAAALRARGVLHEISKLHSFICRRKSFLDNNLRHEALKELSFSRKQTFMS